MKKASDFASELKEDFEEYVRFMTQLGRKFEVETTILKEFDRHLIGVGAASVSADAVDRFAFATPGLTSQQYQKRRSVAAKFADYVALKYGGDLTPAGPRLPSDGKYIAHHYTDEEIGLVLEGLAPRRKGEKFRIASYGHQAIVGLLAATGMRITESLDLTRADVDLAEGIVFIKATKFKKKRYVPVDPTVRDMLADYASDRDHVFPHGSSDAPFFVSSAGTKVSYSTFEGAYKRAVREAGIVSTGSGEARIHDLRHTFCVNRFAAWYAEGVDPADKLVAFSTYLGHVKFESSIYYLDMKAEAMALGSRNFTLGGSNGEA